MEHTSTKHKLCNVCDKALKSLPTLHQHMIWQHIGHVFVCKVCGKTNNSIKRHKKFVCGKPRHRKSFCNFSMWSKDHHRGDDLQSERDGKGGEEDDGSGQLQEEGRYPLTTQ